MRCPSYKYPQLTRHPRARYFGSIIPSALNVFSMQGFLILNCIIGGQTLASVSTHLDDTLGIVIIGVISLAVSAIFLATVDHSSAGLRSRSVGTASFTS